MATETIFATSIATWGQTTRLTTHIWLHCDLINWCRNVQSPLEIILFMQNCSRNNSLLYLFFLFYFCHNTDCHECAWLSIKINDYTFAASANPSLISLLASIYHPIGIVCASRIHRAEWSKSYWEHCTDTRTSGNCCMVAVCTLNLSVVHTYFNIVL